MNRETRRTRASRTRTDKVEVNAAGLRRIEERAEAMERLAGIAVAVLAGRELDRTFTPQEVDALNGANVELVPTPEGGLRIRVIFAEQVVDPLPKVEL